MQQPPQSVQSGPRWISLRVPMVSFSTVGWITSSVLKNECSTKIHQHSTNKNAELM
jgi:hypothetical protein